MGIIFKETDDTADKAIKVGLTLATLLVLGLILNPLGIVKTGEKGIRLRFGAITGNTVEEGLYFRIPFVEKVTKINTQTQKAEVQASAASKDLQTVTATVALNWKVNPNTIQTLYQEYRQDYESRIIAPTIQEAVKSATAQFTADELITKRSDVREKIKVNLKEKLESKGFFVEEFNIVNFDFSPLFNKAVESKVTAEQEALAAKNKLEQVKFESEQEIQKARGRAEALRIEGDALRQNSQLIELRAIEKWNGTLPQYTGGTIPFINLNK